MENTYGWAGKILKIDLTNRKISTIDTMAYAYEYIGGRGIADRIAYEEISGDVDGFDPENRLIIMSGPLTGTMAPASGRVEFAGVAPQTYPRPWYTRSNMGGRFGSELKYAGFDGIVVWGKAEKPVYLWVNDEDVQIVDAGDIWGRDTYSTQKYLMDQHGGDTKIACIGPAGENLVRYAIVLSETKSAAGQGGFGAVMGSKNLKAIAVRGTGAIKIAYPKDLLELSLAVNKAFEESMGRGKRPSASAPPDMVRKYGQKGMTCSHSCPWRCGWFWRNMPGKAYPGINNVMMTCSAWLFRGIKGSFYDWGIGDEAGAEMSALTNKLGLNHWGLLFGVVPWLLECSKAGIITEIDGEKIDFDDPEFWVMLMRNIAYRKGMGDILAEDIPRAVDILGKGEDIAKKLYPAYGYAGHWDGHGDKANPVFFPLWIVSALQWFTDTRDPFSSGHDYSQNLARWSRDVSWDKLAAIGEIIYGSKKAVAPDYAYEYKAQPAIWHQHESILKDSLPLCDQAWPLLYSMRSEDNYLRINLSKHGTIEGKSLEVYLYRATTGDDIDDAELRKRAERIFNLERVIQVNNYGRTREDDIAIIPYFETPENLPGPSGKLESLDREKFLKLVDEYYELRGWDKTTGRPTKEKLTELGLE
ncbi:hypothetical protein FJZ31_31700 [Candidatus Poribacteria bacterium]|nr:hypothetical protein [Candidatus Poribacteria bacterium]